MSFLAKLKQALGFADDCTDELLCDSVDNEETDGQSISETNPFLSDGQPVEQEFSDEVRRGIFNHVIEVFNGSMPVFIRESLDTNAQSDYIFRTLDESIRQYIENFERRAEEQCNMRFRSQQDQLNAEITRLKEQSKKIADDKAAIKERQLSADRQKRALQDRVKELEQQLATLDAEQEQLQLENKSLINKVKVAAIQGSDEQLQAEIARLTADNEKLHEAMNKQADMHTISEAMMADLRQSAAKAREELNDQQVKCRELGAQLGQVQERLTRQVSQNEALISDSTKDRQEIERLRAELDSCHSELRTRRVECDELKDRIAAMEITMLESQPDRNAETELTTEALPESESTAGTNQQMTTQTAPEAETSEVAMKTTEATSEAESYKAAKLASNTESDPEPLMATDPAGHIEPLIAAEPSLQISDEALKHIEINFGEENWTVDGSETTKTISEPKVSRQSKRKHLPSDDMQLTLF